MSYRKMEDGKFRSLTLPVQFYEDCWNGLIKKGRLFVMQIVNVIQ